MTEARYAVSEAVREGTGVHFAPFFHRGHVQAMPKGGNRYERAKLANALAYFALHTERLRPHKACRLLYLLDFEHFAQTGLNVTGLSYIASPTGPVPTLGTDAPGLDARIIEGPFPLFVDTDGLTRRELSIMQDIARTYRALNDEPKVEAPGIANGAWAKIWDSGKGHGAPIPYELGVAEHDPRRTAALDTAEEYSHYIM